MDRAPFTSRSAGVLFWAAGYLAVALALSLSLAGLWPQGSACTTTCNARIESGAITMGLLALGGACGFGIALWLGVTRRAAVPRALARLLAIVLAGSLALSLILLRAATEHGDAAGLETVHSAWTWALDRALGRAARDGRRRAAARGVRARAGAAPALSPRPVAPDDFCAPRPNVRARGSVPATEPREVRAVAPQEQHHREPAVRLDRP